jgi:ATP-dependent Clp endopeptidase proteolytic subunit ClpP
MKKWFEIINKSDKAEIWIYEQIGEDWWSGGGVTAKGFKDELLTIKASQIDLHINSPGGEVFDGITIYNLLKQHSANITTYIDGLAASIASVIALAGNRVVMAENALWMMHNPWGMAIGNAEDMRAQADVLDKVGSSISLAYQSKSGKSEEEIKSWMDSETWMSAAEAQESGFVDEISDQMDIAACAKFIPVMQKAKFKNIPKNLSGDKRPPDERSLERILRDAGCTVKQAKAILSEGYASALRDVEQEGAQTTETKEALRDVETQPTPVTKDRIADLLIRAEIAAPSL